MVTELVGELGHGHDGGDHGLDVEGWTSTVAGEERVHLEPLEEAACCFRADRREGDGTLVEQLHQRAAGSHEDKGT